MEEQQILEKPKRKIDFKLLGIILLVVVAFSFYYFQDKLQRIRPEQIKEKPYQILTPGSYATGTTVSLYKNTPPDFPKEVVLENKTLDYSGTVSTPQGKTQITVSYISDKSMQDIVDIYVRSLPNVGWNIAEKSIYAKVSIVRATKGEQSVLLSIAPLKESEVMVTFQYEK